MIGIDRIEMPWFVLLVALAGCSSPNAAYCDEDRQCSDPIYSRCDLTGELGNRNGCVRPPVDASPGSKSDASETAGDASPTDAALADAAPGDLCAGVDCSGMDSDCTVGMCDPESGACVALPANEDGECGQVSECGGYGACQGFGSVCDESGQQSRTCTDFTCQAGACVESAPYSDTRSCARDTDGDSCGSDTVTDCGGCVYSAGTCDETGTRSCTCTSFSCGSGACVASPSSCSQPSASCDRDTDGDECGCSTTLQCCNQGSCSQSCGGFCEAVTAPHVI
jgi:hypothetical protein